MVSCWFWEPEEWAQGWRAGQAGDWPTGRRLASWVGDGDGKKRPPHGQLQACIAAAPAHLVWLSEGLSEEAAWPHRALRIWGPSLPFLLRVNAAVNFDGSV